MGQHLTAQQRYKIEFLYQQNYSAREIAKHIDVHHTTVSRELRRNKQTDTNVYCAEAAQKQYVSRLRKKKKTIRFTDDMRKEIERLIREEYSPEQIVGIRKLQQLPCVSHERIYQHIWADKKKGGDLYIIKGNSKTPSITPPPFLPLFSLISL